MIGIIDYHLSNIRSVQKAFEKNGDGAFISSDPEELRRAEKLVLPGVGAFGTAMKNLQHLGLDRLIQERVAAGIPLLGICLGMQLLFTKSYENGEFAGLGIISGEVRLFPPKVKVPHIGWNQVEIKRNSRLTERVAKRSYVYFVHSYYVAVDAVTTVASTEYGLNFSSIVQKDRVFGIQFHPEKSQSMGLLMLKNFAVKV
jgi:glutamine amidotransferase